MNSQATPEEPGQILTFYSYKGGTGRSMVLANTACLLAQQPEGNGGILTVDWDLEAPGLHRYFADRFRRQFEGGEQNVVPRQNPVRTRSPPKSTSFPRSPKSRLPRYKNNSRKP